MSKPKPSSASANTSNEAPPWLALLFVGLTGALLGSTGTYLMLRPQLQRAAAPAATAMAGAAMPSAPTDHAPPASLTAGLAPAKADRALGNFHYDHGNWPLAQKHYEAAIRQGEDDADIRTDLGNVYRFSGRPNEALTQYELAQRMNPQHEFSLFNQGGLFLEDLKDPTRAVAAWREYLQRFPNGRNVAAARQLIAQATGSAPVMPAAAPALGQPSARPIDPTEQRLQDLVNQAPKKP